MSRCVAVDGGNVARVIEARLEDGIEWPRRRDSHGTMDVHINGPE